MVHVGWSIGACSIIPGVVEKVKEYIGCCVDVFDPLRCNVVYMFYHTNSQKHIDATKSRPETLNLLDEIF